MTSFRQTRQAYALLLLAVGLCLAGAAQAKTIRVPADFSKIQAAIDAAVNGDVIIVAKRTYKENLDFKGKAITVQSAKPADPAVVAATIIDGQKKGSVVVFTSSEKPSSVLKGFTITNGIGTFDPNGYRQGGGIYCLSTSPTLTYNVITGNRSTRGGGVSCYENSAPKITYNTIRGNTITGSGAGIYCYNSSPTVIRNTITANASIATNTSGGGITCYWYSSPTISNNVISDNLVTATGGTAGGVSCTYNSSPTLTGNTITGNAAGDNGGGVCCQYDSSPTLTNNLIEGNTAAQDGGGVYCYFKSSPVMSGNTIAGNAATAGGGGGVHCTTSSSPVMSNNLICGNSAAKGGGLYSTYSAPNLTNNTLSGNSATSGGGVCCYREANPILRNNIIAFSTRGGGLYVEVDPTRPSTPIVAYCDFWSNTGGEYVNWPSQTGKGGNISQDPLFANAAAGDFHEKSKGGRWDLATKKWILDTVHSPCINAGAPKSIFKLEPAPNGGRINMGAYGNTKYASKTAPAGVGGILLVSAAAAPASGGGAQLSVSLSAAASVEVTITNIAGRPVAALPARDLPEGMSALLWSGKGTSGLRIPSGQYLLRLTARTADGSQAQALSSFSLRR